MFTLGVLFIQWHYCHLILTLFSCVQFLRQCYPIFGRWHHVKVNGNTDVSKVHFGFVFTSDDNRVTLHRTIEYFSALSAIQPTFTRFPQAEMDAASTVTKRPSFFRHVTQRWLVVNWFSPFQRCLLSPFSRVKLSKSLEDDTDRLSRNVINQPPTNVS